MTGSDSTPSLQWYAMSATYRGELKVQETLRTFGISSYVAMTTVEIKRRGRKEMVKKPAVSNLIFVKSTFERLREVKQFIPRLMFKVNRNASGESSAIVVPDNQMEEFIRVTTLMDNPYYLDPSLPEIKIGTPVVVNAGPLEGMHGLLVRNKRGQTPMVVVALEGVIAVAVTIPRALVSKFNV